MPLALLAIGILLIMTGIKGNYADIGAAFEQDVMAQGGFLQFIEGILGIAVFFRLIGMPNAGRVFMILIILVFLMQNANVLSALTNATSSTSTSGSS